MIWSMQEREPGMVDNKHARQEPFPFAAHHSDIPSSLSSIAMTLLMDAALSHTMPRCLSWCERAMRIR